MLSRFLTALTLLCALTARASEPAPPVPGFAPSLAATTAAAPATTPAALTPEPAVAPVVPPRSGEAMEFHVSFMGLSMGKIRLFAGKVDSTVAPVFLQAQTTSIFAIVTLRQQLASYLDVQTGLPRSGSLDAVEGSYRHADTVSFDRFANRAKVREKGKYDNTYLIDVPPDATDFIGLVYRLRTLPLEDGARYAFNVLSGRDRNKVIATVLGREKIETKAGTFEAVKVRVPTGFTGKFSEKKPTFVWFSDDDRRVVVRITADFSIGNATANLVSYTPGTLATPASDSSASETATNAAVPPATVATP